MLKCRELQQYIETNLELVSPPVSAWFLKENIPYFIFYVWLPDSLSTPDCLISWDTEQYVYCNCFPVCNVTNFEINLSFLMKPFSCMTKKVKTKI